MSLIKYRWIAFVAACCFSIISPAGVQAKNEMCKAQGARTAGLSGYIPVTGQKPVPSTPFYKSDGTSQSITDFAGRAVVLNFWATWCPPCIKEMPSLDRLANKVRSVGIDVLAVNEDKKTTALVEQYYRKLALKDLDVLLDRSGALMKAAKVFSLPTTLLIDRNGNEVAGVLGGAEWDDDAIVAFLKKCLLSN